MNIQNTFHLTLNEIITTIFPGYLSRSHSIRVESQLSQGRTGSQLSPGKEMNFNTDIYCLKDDQKEGIERRVRQSFYWPI